MFGQYGTVTKTQVIMDRDTGRSRGFAFVEMSDGADAAVQAMNGADFQGRRLTVNEAKPREERPRTGGGGGVRRRRPGRVRRRRRRVRRWRRRPGRVRRRPGRVWRRRWRLRPVLTPIEPRTDAAYTRTSGRRGAEDISSPSVLFSPVARSRRARTACRLREDGTRCVPYGPASTRRSPSRRVRPTRSRYSHSGTAYFRVVPSRSRISATVSPRPVPQPLGHPPPHLGLGVGVQVDVVGHLRPGSPSATHTSKRSFRLAALPPAWLAKLAGSGGWNPAAWYAATILSFSFRWLALSFGLKSARAIRRRSPTSFFALISRSVDRLDQASSPT